MKFIKYFFVGITVCIAAQLFPYTKFKVRDVLFIALAATIGFMGVDVCVSGNLQEMFEGDITNGVGTMTSSVENGVGTMTSDDITKRVSATLDTLDASDTLDTLDTLDASDTIVPLEACPATPGDVSEAYIRKYGPYLVGHRADLSAVQKRDFVYKFMKLHLLIHQQTAEKESGGENYIRDWNDSQFIAHQLKLCENQQHEFPSFFRHFLKTSF